MKSAKFIALVMAAVAVGALVFIRRGGDARMQEPEVRPVRSVVVGALDADEFLGFPGKICAAESRTLNFKESGRIERIPVSNGQEVKKGELLAWLYKGDFTNRVEVCRAAAERDRLTARRMRDAAKKNAVSQEELSRSEANLRQAEAELELAERALRSCELYAPFDCVVAKVIATELDMVGPADRIVTVQDVSKIKIEVAVPEAVAIVQNRFAAQRPPDGDCSITAEFDSLPEQRFPVTFVEYEAVADKDSQTFRASYVMDDPPKDLLLLPGMSATVYVPERFCRYRGESADAVEVPASAVGVDERGGYFVWVLSPDAQDGVYAVAKRPVETGDRRESKLVIVRGLSKGERVVTAGVAVLTEGRKVTLL